MSLSPQGTPPPRRQAKLRVWAQDPPSCGQQMGPDTDTRIMTHIMDTATDTHTHADVHTRTDTRRHLRGSTNHWKANFENKNFPDNLTE